MNLKNFGNKEIQAYLNAMRKDLLVFIKAQTGTSIKESLHHSGLPQTSALFSGIDIHTIKDSVAEIVDCFGGPDESATYTGFVDIHLMGADENDLTGAVYTLYDTVNNEIYFSIGGQWIQYVTAGTFAETINNFNTTLSQALETVSTEAAQTSKEYTDQKIAVEIQAVLNKIATVTFETVYLEIDNLLVIHNGVPNKRFILSSTNPDATGQTTLSFTQFGPQAAIGARIIIVNNSDIKYTVAGLPSDDSVDTSTLNEVLENKGSHIVFYKNTETNWIVTGAFINYPDPVIPEPVASVEDPKARFVVMGGSNHSGDPISFKYNKNTQVMEVDTRMTISPIGAVQLPFRFEFLYTRYDFVVAVLENQTGDALAIGVTDSSYVFFSKKEYGDFGVGPTLSDYFEELYEGYTITTPAFPTRTCSIAFKRVGNDLIGIFATDYAGQETTYTYTNFFAVGGMVYDTLDAPCYLTISTDSEAI